MQLIKLLVVVFLTACCAAWNVGDYVRCTDANHPRNDKLGRVTTRSALNKCEVEFVMRGGFETELIADNSLVQLTKPQYNNNPFFSRNGLLRRVVRRN